MTDAEILDQAITNNEALHRHLWMFRAMVKELGELKAQYTQTKSSLEVTKQQEDKHIAELEAAKAELATTQNQLVKLKQEIVTLDAQLKDKLQELRNYTEAVDRIRANLNEAA